MKSLNRTLSLVLVLCMVFGLFGVAGAAFTDASTIQYKEAVSVMSGIGAINGYADGTFKPTATITREEAAKMICYAVLGPTVASKLSVTATGFSDVAATRWSAPFIGYAVSTGIINGMGDGTFAPTANVTGYQLAKMLLCAAGYGKAKEFTGASWELNVAVAANKGKVFSGAKTVDYSKAATREEAALYVFNAITKTPTVTYSKLTESYSNNTVAATAVAGDEKVLDDNYVQIAETVYTKLVCDTTPVNGVTGYTWYLDGTAISDFVTDASILATITNGTTIGDASTASSTKYVAALATDADLVTAGTQPVTYFYNGTQVTATAEGVAGTLFVAGNLLYVSNGAAADVQYSVKGAIVTLFGGENANAKKIVSVSIVEKKVVQLTAAPATKTTGSLTKVTIPGVVTDVNVKTVSYPAGLAKDDVVLFYTAADGVTYVEKAAVVPAGAISSYVSNAYVTIGGANYPISGLAGKPGDYDTIGELQALLGKAGFTFYLDNGNNIVYTVAPSSVALLTNTFYVSAVTSTASFTTTYQAMAVKPDGTQTAITVKKVNNGLGMVDVTAIDNTAPTAVAGTLGAKTFYTYTTNADGSYNLTKAANQTIYGTDLTSAGADAGAALTAIDAGDTSYTITAAKANFLSKITVTGANTTWTADAPAPQPVLAHAGTVFMYYDATAKTYTTFTGINNAKSYAAGGTIFVLTDANGFATLVVCAGATASSGASGYDQVFVTSLATVSADANSTATYTYKAVVNGVTDKTITSYSELDAGTLYFIKEYAANGVVVAGTALTTVAGADTAHATVKDISYAGGTFIVENPDGTPVGAYILNANVKIFVVDKTNLAAITVSQVTAEQAAAMDYTANANSLVVVKTSSTDTSIAAIYITVA